VTQPFVSILRVVSVTRRTFLTFATLAASLVGRVRAQASPLRQPVPRDTTKVPGQPASPLGARSRFEALARSPSGTTSTTPLQSLHGTLTPSDLHFEVHRAGVPDIDPHDYRLLIHGLVDRPTIFTLEDLKTLPAVSRICFLECGGNYPRNPRGVMTPAMMAGLTSQSEWTGVPLAVLFREVGVPSHASWFLAEGQDGAAMTRSIPTWKALKDGLLAYAQNGEALRPAQGYPARLILPGWEGVANVKWVRRIKFATEPFMTREETSRYTEELADGRIRQFSFELDARSIITSPAPPTIARLGWMEIRGLAWTGRGRIARVELSTDNGLTWWDTTLDGPVLPEAHVRFRARWHWDGRAATLLSRAIDETGYVQPTLRQLIAARGLNSPGYHMNPIVGWVLDADGRLTVREDPWT
jgi:sulfane dehydrogenase subunit SoxC